MATRSPYAQLPPPSRPDQAIVDAWKEALDRLPVGSTGRVAHLISKPSQGVHVECAVATLQEGLGFAGDHAYKDWYLGKRVPGREVSAVSLDVLTVLGVDPRSVGDNLVVKGFDLAALEPGDRVMVGDAILVRSEAPHRPCPLFRHRTSEEAYHAVRHGRHRGALFTVVRGGHIRVGDQLSLAAQDG